MQESDRAGFYKALTALAETLRGEVTTASLKMYFGALEDLPVDAVIFALNRAARQLKFFPAPVEIRDLIEGTDMDKNQMAWQQFTGAVARFGGHQSVMFRDVYIATAVRETFGGWIEACDTLPLPADPMYANHHKRFCVAYEVARKRGRNSADFAPGYLPGRAEARNRAENLLEGTEMRALMGLVEGPDAVKSIEVTFGPDGRLTRDSRALLGLPAAPPALPGAGPEAAPMASLGAVLQGVAEEIA